MCRKGRVVLALPLIFNGGLLNFMRLLNGITDADNGYFEFLKRLLSMESVKAGTSCSSIWDVPRLFSTVFYRFSYSPNSCGAVSSTNGFNSCRVAWNASSALSISASAMAVETTNMPRVAPYIPRLIISR